VNAIRVNGRPSAISSSVAAVAIGTGRRMTQRESRYQGPLRAPAASRASERRQRCGLSEFTRSPSAPSIAGSSVSDTTAAISAQMAPPTPME
jgi:hypothetical protein